MTANNVAPPLTTLFKDVGTKPVAAMYYIPTAVPGMRILAGKGADAHRVFDTHHLYNQLVGGNALAMSVCRVLYLEEQYFQSALGGSQPKEHDNPAVARLYDLITLLVLKSGHLLAMRDYSNTPAWKKACDDLLGTVIGDSAREYAGTGIDAAEMLFSPTGGVFRHPAAVMFTAANGKRFVLFISDLIQHSMRWREEASPAHEALVNWTKAMQVGYSSAIEAAAADEINVIIAAAKQARDTMTDWPDDYPLFRKKTSA